MMIHGGQNCYKNYPFIMILDWKGTQIWCKNVLFSFLKNMRNHDRFRWRILRTAFCPFAPIVGAEAVAVPILKGRSVDWTTLLLQSLLYSYHYAWMFIYSCWTSRCPDWQCVLGALLSWAWYWSGKISSPRSIVVIDQWTQKSSFL